MKRLLAEDGIENDRGIRWFRIFYSMFLLIFFSSKRVLEREEIKLKRLLLDYRWVVFEFLKNETLIDINSINSFFRKDF